MRSVCAVYFKLVFFSKIVFSHLITEIEEKEDAMTKLYKQLDLKNIEVLKYKSLAEKAKVSSLKLLSFKVNAIHSLLVLLFVGRASIWRVNLLL